MLPSIIQLLINAAISSSMLFIPNLATSLGASKTEVGIIGAVYGFALFISAYIFGQIADVYNRRTLLKAGFFAAAISFFLQIFAGDVYTLSLARGIAGLSAGIFPAAFITYVYSMKKKVGGFISLGSLGWAAGNFLAGILAVYREIFALSSLLFAIAFFLSTRLPEVGNEGIKIHFFSSKPIKQNLHVYLSFLSRHTGAWAVWIVFPLYLVDLGASLFWIGIIYALNPLIQFLIMRKLDRFRSTTLIKAGFILSILTFISFTLARDFYQIIPAQFLLASSWSCIYVGSASYLLDRSAEKATSIGILESTINLSSIIGPLLGGIIWELYGYAAVMYFAAILSLIGLSIFMASRVKFK